ncbi:hypothetical protein ACIGHN_26940 [Acidovorax sp. NPDC077693]|uniref:hypothetical protein n=1 Tax=unclassified Acidovorax TaxID=2684926 RepID=UPI0037C71ACD
MKKIAKKSSISFGDLRPTDSFEQGPQKFYEGGYFIVILIGILAIFMLFPALWMLSAGLPGTLGVALGFAMIGAGFAAFGFFLWRRRKTPFLEMTEDGFCYPDLLEPIPWGAVNDITIGAGASAWENIIIGIDLNHLYSVQLLKPEIKNVQYSVRRVWFNAKTNRIVIKVVNVRGMANRDFIDRVVSYWRIHAVRE